MSRPRWLRQRELRNFAYVTAWCLGLLDLWTQGWSPLIKEILRLWKASGSVFTVQYLKECVRILQKWIASQDRGTSVPSVRLSNDGLPLFIPAPLRTLIRAFKYAGDARGRYVFKGVLTILSVYRVMGITPIRKLNTITDSFSGISSTLPGGELVTVLGWLPRRLSLRRRPVSLPINESAGPNYPRSTWGSPLDALAFLREPRVWFCWIAIACHNGYYLHAIWQIVIVSIALPVLGPLWVLGLFPWPVLGKLQELIEGAGKVRVIAVTDWWTQLVLTPLHDGIFSILKEIPQDGTHNQTKPLEKIRERARLGSGVWSFDLSAATDRLPINLQVQILQLLGIWWAPLWSTLLSGRNWWLKGIPYRYSVGQPMGARSSWALLAITHHVIVQVAALRAGWNQWFPFYAVLGDDIVIADEAVASAYLQLMIGLGVEISPKKGLISRSTFEFAKRTVHCHRGDVSPLGAGAILVCIRNLRYIPTLLLDMVAKEVALSPGSLISDIESLCKQLRRKPDASLAKLIAITALGPFGLAAGDQSPWNLTSIGYWVQLLQPGGSPAMVLQTILRWYRQKAMDQWLLDSIQAQCALITFKKEWWHVSVLGKGLYGILSIPLVFVSPAFWSYLLTLRASEMETREQPDLLSDQLQVESSGWTSTVFLPIAQDAFSYLREDLSVDVLSFDLSARRTTVRLLEDAEWLIRSFSARTVASHQPRGPGLKGLVPYTVTVEVPDDAAA